MRPHLKSRSQRAWAVGTVHHFVPQARNYARAHIVLHVFALLAWGLSLLIATPARVSLWYVSIFFDIALNFVISEQNRVGGPNPASGPVLGVG